MIDDAAGKLLIYEMLIEGTINLPLTKNKVNIPTTKLNIITLCVSPKKV